MNYTVVWQPPALATLAKLWTDGPDRNAVAAASDSIDARLARDPLSQGESRDGPHRILFVAPLVVDFEVREAERTVLVLCVRRTRWVAPG
jgi:hypothetical protein